MGTFLGKEVEHCTNKNAFPLDCQPAVVTGAKAEALAIL